MRTKFLNYFLSLVISASAACIPAYGQKVPEITFIESFDDFPNPERGFYHHRSLIESQEFDFREKILRLYSTYSC